MRGIFVSGTDTNVGKTVVAAALLKQWFPAERALYWKPVQTGASDDDTETARRLTALPESAFLPPVYRFSAPLSPHLAARAEEDAISPDALRSAAVRINEQRVPIIVEGAGGLLVPYTSDFLQIDFIKMLELPVLLVATDRVGAINHVLLSIEACWSRSLTVAGIVLNRFQPETGNLESLREFSGVPVIGTCIETKDPRLAVATLSRSLSLACDAIQDPRH